jgi:hypothetical protein
VWGNTVIELPSGEMFRIHEQLGVISSDRDKLPFLVFEIEHGSGSTGRDFTWMFVQDTIHGSRFISYRYFNLEFQERRMQTGHDGQMIMIKVVQQQHGGSFLRLAWDPRISVLDNSTDTEVRAIFCFHEIGSLVEKFFEGLIELLQYRVSLLSSSIQEASYVHTLPDPIERRMLHIFQGGLGPWYHFQFQSGSTDGASGCDGIA